MTGIMGDNFQTDIKPQDLIDLAKNMLAANARTTYSYTIKGEGRLERPGGAWYYDLDAEILSRQAVDPAMT
jgi:anionic cell wall polymer biosynthesis LytR-Cps2A-Psr (LCP) family protein